MLPHRLDGDSLRLADSGNRIGLGQDKNSNWERAVLGARRCRRKSAPKGENWGCEEPHPTNSDRRRRHAAAVRSQERTQTGGKRWKTPCDVTWLRLFDLIYQHIAGC